MSLGFNEGESINCDLPLQVSSIFNQRGGNVVVGCVSRTLEILVKRKITKTRTDDERPVSSVNRPVTARNRGLSEKMENQ